MNRTDVSHQIADELDVSYSYVDQIVVAFFDALVDALDRREPVQIRGFGTFEPRERRAATLQHPGSRKPVHVPAQVTVGLRPSAALKRRMNGRKGSR